MNIQSTCTRRQSMRTVRWFALSACVLAAIGCGGGGGNSPAVTAYYGSTVGIGPAIGGLTLKMQPATSTGSRAITGTAQYGAQVVGFYGTVDSNGKGQVQVTTNSSSYGSAPIQLGLTPGSNIATLSLQNGTQTVLAIMEPGTGGVPQNVATFGGYKAGTITDTTLGKSEPFAHDALPDGSLTGWIIVYANGNPVLSSISGTLTSTGALSFTVTATGVAVSGQLVIDGPSMTASLTESNGDAATLLSSSGLYHQGV